MAVVAAHKLQWCWVRGNITAIGTIKSYFEQISEDLKGKASVEGFPKDFESVRSLFGADLYLFQA